MCSTAVRMKIAINNLSINTFIVCFDVVVIHRGRKFIREILYSLAIHVNKNKSWLIWIYNRFHYHWVAFISLCLRKSDLHSSSINISMHAKPEVHLLFSFFFFCVRSFSVSLSWHRCCLFCVRSFVPKTVDRPTYQSRKYVPWSSTSQTHTHTHTHRINGFAFENKNPSFHLCVCLIFITCFGIFFYFCKSHFRWHSWSMRLYCLLMQNYGRNYWVRRMNSWSVKSKLVFFSTKKLYLNTRWIKKFFVNFDVYSAGNEIVTFFFRW